MGNPIPILDEKFDWDADVFNFKFEIGLSPDLKLISILKPPIYHKINVENKIIEERITYLQQQYGELKDEKKIDTSELMFEFSSKKKISIKK